MPGTGMPGAGAPSGDAGGLESREPTASLSSRPRPNSLARSLSVTIATASTSPTASKVLPRPTQGRESPEPAGLGIGAVGQTQRMGGAALPPAAPMKNIHCSPGLFTPRAKCGQDNGSATLRTSGAPPVCLSWFICKNGARPRWVFPLQRRSTPGRGGWGRNLFPLAPGTALQPPVPLRSFLASTPFRDSPAMGLPPKKTHELPVPQNQLNGSHSLPPPGAEKTRAPSTKRSCLHRPFGGPGGWGGLEEESGKPQVSKTLWKPNPRCLGLGLPSQSPNRYCEGGFGMGCQQAPKGWGRVPGEPPCPPPPHRVDGGESSAHLHPQASVYHRNPRITILPSQDSKPILPLPAGLGTAAPTTQGPVEAPLGCHCGRWPSHPLNPETQKTQMKLSGHAIWHRKNDLGRQVGVAFSTGSHFSPLSVQIGKLTPNKPGHSWTSARRPERHLPFCSQRCLAIFTVPQCPSPRRYTDPIALKKR